MTDHDWPNLVGRFILAFGEIEDLCTTSIRMISVDGIGGVAATLPLESRIQLLHTILDGRSDSESRELSSALKRVKSYLTHRNLVAHNGLGMKVVHNGNKILLHFHIQSSRNADKMLSYEQMERLTSEVEHLRHELSQVALDLWQLVHPSDEE